MSYVPRIPCVPPDIAKLRLTTAERRAHVQRLLDLRKSKFTSLHLFFNLTNPATTKNVSNYRATAAADVRSWLHEGEAITTSQFVQNYWSALSYGQFVPSVDANRDAGGNILIPTIAPAGNDGQDWGNIADQIARANAEQIWKAAGSITDGSKRIIPSLVVVQNYDTNASAVVGDWDDEFAVGGQTYHIVHLLHIRYSLNLNDYKLPNVWSTLCHEYSHNFLGGYDLYGGGGGKIGYWDILGDNSPPGHMSDTSSYHKNIMGWITYTNVIKGPVAAAGQYSLNPYATSGEAIQIIPDPAHNPGEYFLLEYRTPTPGNTAWVPDGNVQESGLLITHINERLGDAAGQVVSSSPFMDICEADGNDGKCWDTRVFCDLPWSDPANAHSGDPGVSTYPPNNWPAWNRAPGVLYPFAGKDSFTPNTTPNSNLYGAKDSGLSVTGIQKSGGQIVFTIQMAGNNQQARSLSPNDRTYFADFNGDGKDEALIFDGQNLTLAATDQDQLLAIWQAQGGLGGWRFGSGDRIHIGDFNGDGRADVFIRSAQWAGLLLCDGQSFSEVWMTGDPAQNQNWIGTWHLGPNDSEYVGDFDGDGCDDIFIRSPQWAGLIRSTGSSFDCVWMSGDPAQNRNWISGWHLGPNDRHYVGDFDGDGRADIFIRSDQWAALLLSTGQGFENVWMTGDPAQNKNWIGGWHLGPGDQHYVGDFDGDGRADIFIRSDHWAGLLLSTGRGFNNVWMTGDPAQNKDWIDGWHLGPGDRHLVGDFNGDGRADIFIRSDQWAAILTSSGNGLHVEWMSGDPAKSWNWIGQWQLQAGDQQVAARLNYDPFADVFVYRPGQSSGSFIEVRDSNTGKMSPQLGWLSGNQLAGRDPGPPVARLMLGHFTSRGAKDLVAFDGQSLTLFQNHGGDFRRIWQARNWLGGWHFGPFDRLMVGDFNGDGLEDIFIRSPQWAGLLLSTGAGFNEVWMTGDPAQNQNWIGGWHLGPQDRHYVGDFNGDGKADIFIRSPQWAGLLLSTGAGFNEVWMTGDPAQNQNWIGGWHLSPQDRHIVSDFNGDGKQDIYIRSNEWVGLLVSNGNRLDSALVQQGRVNAWELNSFDREQAGRLTGVNRDEIFASHPIGWAGIFTPSAGAAPGQLNLTLTRQSYRQLEPGSLAAAVGHGWRDHLAATRALSDINQHEPSAHPAP